MRKGSDAWVSVAREGAGRLTYGFAVRADLPQGVKGPEPEFVVGEQGHRFRHRWFGRLPDPPETHDDPPLNAMIVGLEPAEEFPTEGHGSQHLCRNPKQYRRLPPEHIG